MKKKVNVVLLIGSELLLNLIVPTQSTSAMPQSRHRNVAERAVDLLPPHMQAEVSQYAEELSQGAYDEDEWTIWQGLSFTYLHHGWDPKVNGYWYHWAPLGNRGSALEWADHYFEQALVEYRIDKAAAYHTLGRVAHLLGDIATPAHVYLESHGPLGCPDAYEDYLVANKSIISQSLVQTWDYRDLRCNVPVEFTDQVRDAYNQHVGGNDSSNTIWTNGPVIYTNSSLPSAGNRVDPDLFHIFYKLAEITNDYDGDIHDGEGVGSSYHANRGWRHWIQTCPLDDYVDDSFALHLTTTLMPESARAIANMLELFWERKYIVNRGLDF